MQNQQQNSNGLQGQNTDKLTPILQSTENPIITEIQADTFTPIDDFVPTQQEQQQNDLNQISESNVQCPSSTDKSHQLILQSQMDSATGVGNHDEPDKDTYMSLNEAIKDNLPPVVSQKEIPICELPLPSIDLNFCAPQMITLPAPSEIQLQTHLNQMLSVGLDKQEIPQMADFGESEEIPALPLLNNSNSDVQKYLNRESADDQECIPDHVYLDKERLMQVNRDNEDIVPPRFDRHTKTLTYMNLAKGKGYVKECIEYCSKVCGSLEKLVDLVHWIRDEKKMDFCPSGYFIGECCDILCQAMACEESFKLSGFQLAAQVYLKVLLEKPDAQSKWEVDYLLLPANSQFTVYFVISCAKLAQTAQKQGRVTKSNLAHQRYMDSVKTIRLNQTRNQNIAEVYYQSEFDSMTETDKAGVISKREVETLLTKILLGDDELSKIINKAIGTEHVKLIKMSKICSEIMQLMQNSWNGKQSTYVERKLTYMRVESRAIVEKYRNENFDRLRESLSIVSLRTKGLDQVVIREDQDPDGVFNQFGEYEIQLRQTHELVKARVKQNASRSLIAKFETQLAHHQKYDGQGADTAAMKQLRADLANAKGLLAEKDVQLSEAHETVILNEAKYKDWETCKKKHPVVVDLIESLHTDFKEKLDDDTEQRQRLIDINTRLSEHLGITIQSDLLVRKEQEKEAAVKAANEKKVADEKAIAEAGMAQKLNPGMTPQEDEKVLTQYLVDLLTQGLLVINPAGSVNYVTRSSCSQEQQQKNLIRFNTLRGIPKWAKAMSTANVLEEYILKMRKSGFVVPDARQKPENPREPSKTVNVTGGTPGQTSQSSNGVQVQYSKPNPK